MQMRRLIAAGLLFAVLLSPALGLALCQTTAPAAAHSGCRMCAKMQEPAHSTPAAPAPCCQRKAPMPALGESFAQVVPALQIALLHAPAQTALLPAAAPSPSVDFEAAPPPLGSPLALLCTLRI